MDVDPRWRVSEASAASPAEAPDVPELVAPKPWLTMWWAPRRTVRGLIASEQRPSWIPVVALAGINSSLLLLLNGSGEALRDPGSAVGFAVFQGGLQLVYGVLISPFLIALVAGWFGGDGDAEDVRLAIAWAYVPVAATVILWLPLVAAFGWQAFRMNTETPTPLQALSLLLYVPLGLAPTYSFVLQVGGVAAALRTSIWRTLAILLVLAVPVFLLMIALR
jgi:hypothetical protein